METNNTAISIPDELPDDLRLLLECHNMIDFLKQCNIEITPTVERILEETKDERLVAVDVQENVTMVYAAMALHQCIYNTDTVVILTTRTFSQSRQLGQHIKDLHSQFPFAPKIISSRSHPLRCRLDNGSTIVTSALNEVFSRGMSFKTVYITDFADSFTDPKPCFDAVYPCVAVRKGGQIIVHRGQGKYGYRFDELLEHGTAFHLIKD